MRLEQEGQIAAAMDLYAGNATIDDRIEFNAEQVPYVAAPFCVVPKYVLYRKDASNFFRIQQLFLSSTANVVRILVHVADEEANTPEVRSPSELVQGIRYLGGLTWAQVAEIFSVSLRAVFDWAAGKAVTAQHHKHLGNVFATLEYIDRGSAEENINLLMSTSQDGITCFDLLKKDQCDQVRAIAGEGQMRLSYKKTLSEEAVDYNAPMHFGHSIEESLVDEDVEVVLTRKPKVRRAKVQRNKA